MTKIEAKPYKLFGQIQYYEWGTKNENAFIPKYLGFNPELNVPYAEYWIGAHQKSPSTVNIDGKEVSLLELIKNNPVEILGERVCNKFNYKLPFLLKILSINQALSIQAHPDKILAEELNRRDPQNYPDDNHKPEIAIAIDHLEAIVGLKEISEIQDLFLQYPEIKELIDDELYTQINDHKLHEENELMKMFFSNLMNADDEKIKTSIDKVLSRIKSKESKSKIEDRFLIEFENYGYDVGLLSLLSFNHINLKHGEAIFTPAGIPHAYLEGNIIECMANSDNVVRAGLTPKYKDIDTLIRMLSVDSTDIFVQNVEESGKLIYKTTAEEFQVERINVTNIKISNNKEINILLILNGEVEIIFSGKQSNFFREGEVILIPATLSEFTISTNNKTNLYRVIVP